MAGSFDVRKLDQLDVFLHDWNDPEHEFLDPELENKRKHLHTLINDYYKCIGCYTFPKNMHVQEVPDEWEREQPKKYQDARKELHDFADQIATTHADLVRTARRTLGVDELPKTCGIGHGIHMDWRNIAPLWDSKTGGRARTHWPR
jgi:hypothetical protein